MPYPNESSCRMHNPDKFQKDSFRRIKRDKLSIILGKLMGEDTMTAQAYRYPKDSWDMGDAKDHCKKAGGTFEPATGSGELGEARTQVTEQEIPYEEIWKGPGPVIQELDIKTYEAIMPTEDFQVDEVLIDGGGVCYRLVDAAEMKTEGGIKYPSDAYAYVPDKDLPSTWKLRLWEDPEKKVTIRQLGRAAAAFSAGGFRGQKVEISSEDVAKVKARIRAEYRKLDVDDENIPASVKESGRESGRVIGLFQTKEEALRSHRELVLSTLVEDEHQDSYSHYELHDLLHGALQSALHIAFNNHDNVYIRDIYPQELIYSWDGYLYKIPYQVLGHQVFLGGNPQRVVAKTIYEPVEEAAKTEDGAEYPPEAYAYVPDLDKPSTWKLRLWQNTTDKITISQLGRAASAFSPGGHRGQKVDLPPEDVSAVKSKIRAAYRKLGVKNEDMPSSIKESTEISDSVDVRSLTDAEREHILSLQPITSKTIRLQEAIKGEHR